MRDAIFFLIFSQNGSSLRFLPPDSAGLQQLLYPIFVRFSNRPDSPVFSPPLASFAGCVSWTAFSGFRIRMQGQPFCCHDMLPAFFSSQQMSPDPNGANLRKTFDGY